MVSMSSLLKDSTYDIVEPFKFTLSVAILIQVSFQFHSKVIIMIQLATMQSSKWGIGAEQPVFRNW